MYAREPFAGAPGSSGEIGLTLPSGSLLLCSFCSAVNSHRSTAAAARSRHQSTLARDQTYAPLRYIARAPPSIPQGKSSTGILAPAAYNESPIVAFQLVTRTRSSRGAAKSAVSCGAPCRIRRREVVLAADACYFCQTLRARLLPDTASAALAALRRRPRGDARLARSARSTRTGRRAHLLRPRPGSLAICAASSPRHHMKLPNGRLRCQSGLRLRLGAAERIHPPQPRRT